MNIGLLYDTFAANIFAIEEIVEFLETSGEPQTEEAIMDFLKQNLDVEWSTFAQVNFRLWWLLNLEKVKKTDDGWVLV